MKGRIMNRNPHEAEDPTQTYRIEVNDGLEVWLEYVDTTHDDRGRSDDDVIALASSLVDLSGVQVCDRVSPVDDAYRLYVDVVNHHRTALHVVVRRDDGRVDVRF